MLKKLPKKNMKTMNGTLDDNILKHEILLLMEFRVFLWTIVNVKNEYSLINAKKFELFYQSINRSIPMAYAFLYVASAKRVENPFK
ncbi:hypothetical protein C2H98_25335 [Niallia circulans]|jgi:hypothetical protein|uniref:Uncharacterized protein n=3 Tax=Niallia TaxID=2837506 RepID=A0AA91TPN7_NIACI|nr:hypothetical protein C2H98_25335 [Niallia circulans]PAD81536.1 hypothetical protein CHH57_19085 [Niallia circulans]